MRVDAHHHLWKYTPKEYSWIDESLEALRQDFLPADLEAEAARAGVDATIAVQARQTLEETKWLLKLAAASSLIRGVVGWAPIAAEEFAATLERLQTNRLLRGLRHVVQSEPDGFLNGREFNRGIGLLRDTGLVYDILVFAQQLPEAIRFVDRHPNQVFVVDHIAKPDIRGGEFDVWNQAMRELALRQNVSCKVSGMVAEADWNKWTIEQLTPYFDTVLEAFGPARLMAGSDWPVLNVASTYTEWWGILSHWLKALSASERSLIEGDVATRIYQLQA